MKATIRVRHTREQQRTRYARDSLVKLPERRSAFVMCARNNEGNPRVAFGNPNSAANKESTTTRDGKKQ